VALSVLPEVHVRGMGCPLSRLNRGNLKRASSNARVTAAYNLRLVWGEPLRSGKATLCGSCRAVLEETRPDLVRFLREPSAPLVRAYRSNPTRVAADKLPFVELHAWKRQQGPDSSVCGLVFAMRAGRTAAPHARALKAATLLLPYWQGRIRSGSSTLCQACAGSDPRLLQLVQGVVQPGFEAVAVCALPEPRRQLLGGWLVLR